MKQAKSKGESIKMYCAKYYAGTLAQPQQLELSTLSGLREECWQALSDHSCKTVKSLQDSKCWSVVKVTITED